jgi:hypothetical protein
MLNTLNRIKEEKPVMYVVEYRAKEHDDSHIYFTIRYLCHLRSQWTIQKEYKNGACIQIERNNR